MGSSEPVAFAPEFDAPLDSVSALFREPPLEFRQESAVPAPLFLQPHLDISAKDLFSFLPSQPLPDISDEDLFGFLNAPGFDSKLFFNTPNSDLDAQIAALAIDFSAFDDQLPLPPTPSSSQQDWPVLPSASPQSPACNSPVASPVTPPSPPRLAGRKRKMEVDPANITSGPRARKPSVRSS